MRSQPPVSYVPGFTAMALFAVLSSGCSSGRNNPDRSEVAEHSSLPDPTQPASSTAAGDTVDTQMVYVDYSDAPQCNALTRRIANEMLPCLQRVKPELAPQLQVAIDDFGNRTRLRVDRADRVKVLGQLEENCLYHWRAIQHQLDSKAPEGECLLRD